METNVSRAHAYYTCIGHKDAEGIKKYLHDDVEFSSPLTTAKRKEAVIKTTSGFMNAFKTLTIRTQFGSNDQAVIVYDTNIPGISDNFPGVSLLTFKDGLISKIELFFDASLFRSK